MRWYFILAVLVVPLALGAGIDIIGKDLNVVDANIYASTGTLFSQGIEVQSGVFTAALRLPFLSSPCDALGLDNSGYVVCSALSGGSSISGSGDVNHLAIWTGLTTLGSSSIVENSGLVGIGITPSTYRLEVNGYVNALSGLCIAGSCITSWSDVNQSSTSPTYWEANGSNIYNTNAGNVGIGTSSPAYKLDVNGTTRATDLRVEGSANITNTLYASVIQATKFTDSSNTSFYLIPSGTSELNVLNVNIINGATPITSSNIGSYAVTSVTAGSGLTGGGGPGDIAISLSNPFISCSSGAITEFNLISGAVTCIPVDTNSTNEIQDIFQNVSDGSNTATADSPSDTLTIQGGTGISVSVDATTDTVTVTNTGDTNPSDDLTTSTSFGGDISGTYDSIIVVGIQGRPVSSAAPTAGQVLEWNGDAWVPSTVSGGTTGVDGTGTAGHLALWLDTNTLTSSSIVESSSKVGINIGSPSTTLDVNGTTTTIDLKVTGSATVDNTIYASVVEANKFADASDPLHYVIPSGTSFLSALRVGQYLAIGSTAPRNTSPSFILPGSTSDFSIAIQDGTGRVNVYWNSSPSTHTYLVDSEAAARIRIHPPSDPWVTFYWAPAGTQGAAISWQQGLSLYQDGSAGAAAFRANKYIDTSGNTRIEFNTDSNSVIIYIG